MNDLIVGPVALPALVGGVQVLLANRAPIVQRILGIAAALALLAIAVALLTIADHGRIEVYTIGDWRAPLGIVLVLDRLSAWMLLLTSLVALASLAHALGGWDIRGPNFHGLFMFQLAGINGAFLTGDLFNLFVFFEILLIASFCLLLHGGGEERLRAGGIYVGMNLIGSALFLIAVGLLYGVTGTLNIAHLARMVADLDGTGAVLARIAGVLLLLVFGLKAALVPLHWWLPSGYAAAAAPVAALFAIMTKVGAYAILRVFTVIFGASAGDLAWLAAPWLLPAALVTLWLGMLGAMGSRSLGELVSFLLIASVGTILIAFALFEDRALSAGLYYLAHSVLVSAGLYLLIEPVAAGRGATGDGLGPGPPPIHPHLLGFGFLAGTLAIVGLPPLSGFIGKMMVLQSAPPGPVAVWLYLSLLLTALFGLIGCSRAGALVFWAGEGRSEARAPIPPVIPGLVLIAGSLALTVAAGPVVAFTQRTAEQVMSPSAYMNAVLGYELAGGQP